MVVQTLVDIRTEGSSTLHTIGSLPLPLGRFRYCSLSHVTSESNEISKSDPEGMKTILRKRKSVYGNDNDPTGRNYFCTFSRCKLTLTSQTKPISLSRG
jgi:hypothetical protein